MIQSVRVSKGLRLDRSRGVATDEKGFESGHMLELRPSRFDGVVCY